MNRRAFMAAAGSMAALPAFGADKRNRAFPPGFLWGTATAGHQVEGNNVASDLWLLEHLQPTLFAEPSGDAVNSFERWPQDLDIVKGLGLNTYRFSLEWARIEPEPGLISVAMLDHYKAMIEGCRARGLTPFVTYNHFTVPRWFAARGGWTNRESIGWFAKFCERATRHLGAGIGYAITLNEPQLFRMLRWHGLPPQFYDGQRAMLEAAARAVGTPKFVSANVINKEDLDVALPILLEAHKAARTAIKSVRPDLPVGVSLCVTDDQAVGRNSQRDAKRADAYGAWLEAAKGDDFIGVQNYERSRLDAQGMIAPPKDALRNQLGGEIYAPSLEGAVRYVHDVTGAPIIVTEHGVSTTDDAVRAQFIPAALEGLKAAMDDGVPVGGYIHWSLLDNFEWSFGFRPRFGLVAVDRETFARMPKPSAHILGAIARRNSL